MTGRARLIAILAAGIAAFGSAAAGAAPLDTTVVAPRGGDPAPTVAGHIRILRVLQLPSAKIDGQRLAELSDLAWDEDDRILYALSDKGVLFWLRPRFQGDVLDGVDALRAVPLRDARGRRLHGKHADSEGLDILRGDNGRRGDSELIVSFEREPRILRFRPDGTPLGGFPLPAVLADVKSYRNPNKALEAVAVVPGIGLVTAPELPLVDQPLALHRLYALTGRRFTYRADEDAAIVSLKAIAPRVVLTLERDFEPLFGGTRIWLRRVRLGRDGRAEATTLARLDSRDGWNLDNYEGLTRYRGKRFFLVSDNNNVFFQRTLLLYFELR